MEHSRSICFDIYYYPEFSDLKPILEKSLDASENLTGIKEASSWDKEQTFEFSFDKEAFNSFIRQLMSNIKNDLNTQTVFLEQACALLSIQERKDQNHTESKKRSSTFNPLYSHATESTKQQPDNQKYINKAGDYLLSKLGKKFMAKYGAVWTLVSDADYIPIAAEISMQMTETNISWFRKKVSNCTFEATSATSSASPSMGKVIIPITAEVLNDKPNASAKKKIGISG
jgi:hypothetical protein